MLTIAVVIPAYNAASYLADALASVAAQTRRPAEVIVVDDHSTDGTAAIARQWGARVLTTHVNSGPSAARNLGIGAATTDLIAFLDADDFWEPGHLAIVAGLLDLHPTAVLANARCRIFGAWSSVTAAHGDAETPQHVLMPLLAKNLVTQTTVVVRRDAVLAVGGYDVGLRYAEDYALWMTLARSHAFVFSHAITGHYRVHVGQATQDRPAIAAGQWAARERQYAWLVAQDDAALLAAAKGVLQRAIDMDARTAWIRPDRVILERVLTAAAWVPGAARIVRAWRWRIAALWPIWSGIKRARHAARRTGWDSLQRTCRSGRLT